MAPLDTALRAAAGVAGPEEARAAVARQPPQTDWRAAIVTDPGR